MTLGEYRVGLSFNPGGNPNVDKIKRAAADLIDICAGIHVSPPSPPATRDDPEVLRLWALAMTHIEDAAMWAVKAATKTKMES